MSMRGLTVFIADIRKCRVRELEEKRINKELAHIRVKFKEGNLSGYDRKKYICKLLYCYVLGWDISFGHAEAITLLSSQKYSEKQIGYLAVALLLNEDNEMIRLVINSIRKDLQDRNEIFNCLALHAIANNGSREMAESLAEEVERLLISEHTKPFVKKKAALCLLRLIRKHPDICLETSWAESFHSLLHHYDMGVNLAAAHLLTFMVSQFPTAYAKYALVASQRLQEIISQDRYAGDYVYYKVPNPWLQIALMRLIMSFPSIDDDETKEGLIKIIGIILSNMKETPKNTQHNNAQNAIISEAVRMVIYLGDPSRSLFNETAQTLSTFIVSKETNFRYVGLGLMSHLAKVDPKASQEYQDTVFQALKDKDIGVRRRALDLLYSLCDNSTAKDIVAELLLYIPVADSSLREELVLKIAVLTEEYATDLAWYVQTMLQLISLAGDDVSEEVWFRVVQIIVNSKEVHLLAARSCYKALKTDKCHEKTVKIAAYVLGEFGHLIMNDIEASPLEQFAALHSKFLGSHLETRVQLLNSYIKLFVRFPEVWESVREVMQNCSYSLNPELQQRACEYLALINMGDRDLLATVLEPIPPFPERESLLLTKINHQLSHDKRKWVLSVYESSNKPEQPDMEEEKAVTQMTNMIDLLDIEELPEEDILTSREVVLVTNTAIEQHAIPKELTELSVQAGEEYFLNLLHEQTGLLFVCNDFQLFLHSEYLKSRGMVKILLRNFSSITLENVQVEIFAKDVDIAIDVPFQNTIFPGEEVILQLNVECSRLFKDNPLMRICYGLSFQEKAQIIRLPIVITKFAEPVVGLSSSDFFARWKQLGPGSPNEVQKVIITMRNLSLEALQGRIHRLGFGIQDIMDTNRNNIVGVSVMYSKIDGTIACLLRLEPNFIQKV